MGLGFGELVLIVLILLVVFGGAKLPQIGDALGRAIRNFKRGVVHNDGITVTPKLDREVKSELSKPAAARGDAKATAAKAAPDVEDAKVEPKPKA
ncbi:MAG: twin-arginine translocase TatA/TatE family subunit [Deltaproteobacteria bacterium]|nr:twin-arginine translocase TatA/TatE family subunit [Deltaproteobacteria bacterium]